MILSRSADYGLRALIYLAQHGREDPVRLEEIAQAQKVPPTLLSKILQTLVKAKVLRSQKGYRGGFVLMADPAGLPLDEVIQLIDGPFMVFECLADDSFCTLCAGCKLRVKFQELQEAMRGVLGRTTIADLIPDDDDACTKVPAAGSRASGRLLPEATDPAPDR